MALQFFKDKLAGGGVAIKRTIVNGAAAATNIAVAGAAADAKLVAVIMFTAGVPSDVTADATIVNGNLKLAVTNSTGNKLDVHWAQAA